MQNNESHLERQWDVLEAHYQQNRPIIGRLLGITDGEMRVDVCGVQGYIDHFVYAFTTHSSIEETGQETASLTEAMQAISSTQQRFANLYGKEMLLRIVALDRGQKILRLSQKLHDDETIAIETFAIGSIYTGIVTALNPAFIRVSLRGVTGRIFSRVGLPDEPHPLDLTTVLHLGQEVTVTVVNNKGNTLIT